ncbi:MAG: peptidase domain-containing ABC transporter [Pseudomonadota bacterium]
MDDTDNSILADLILAGTRAKLPVILQSEAAECGLACLAMIATFHGRAEDLASMRRRFAVSLKGATLAQLVDVADTVGLAARPLRLDLPDIADLECPCILHWDLNHFVVLKSVANGRAIIHDPASGVRRMRVEEISDHFTGVALELTPTSEFVRKKATPKIRLWDFWTKITGLKRSLLQILGLSALLQAIALATPFYSQLVVDEAILSGDLSFLNVLLLGFLLLFAIECVTSLLRAGADIYLSNMLSTQMQANTFRHVVRLPLDWFEKRHLGDVSSRFDSLQPIKELITGSLVAVAIDGVMALTTLALMLLYSVKMTLVIVCGLIVYFTMRLAIFPYLRRKSQEGLQLKARLDTLFLESIRGARAIKLFGREQQRQAQWRNAQVTVVNNDVQLQKAEAVSEAASRLIVNALRILVIYLAAQMVIKAEFTLGMLFAFIAYQNHFAKSVEGLIDKMIEWRIAQLHLERLADIVHAQTEATEQSYLSVDEPLNGEIELRGVSFRYAEHEPFIFKDINLKIRANETVAILGGSGQGKTTLLKVMIGLLEPTAGEVLFDGRPISAIGLRALRRRIGVVMQDDQLLSGSLAENIAFFDEDIDMARIEACARLASVYDDIMSTPMGFNTLIGDMGSTLSGGQKQRVLLARALYREPSMLFLDEGTANLDDVSEKSVLETLESYSGTKVLIAHRSATLRIATKVVVLKDGAIRVGQRSGGKRKAGPDRGGRFQIDAPQAEAALF